MVCVTYRSGCLGVDLILCTPAQEAVLYISLLGDVQMQHEDMEVAAILAMTSRQSHISSPKDLVSGSAGFILAPSYDKAIYVRFWALVILAQFCYLSLSH